MEIVAQIPAWFWIMAAAAAVAAVVGVSQGFYWTWVSTRAAEHERLARRLGTSVAEQNESTIFRDVAADAAADALGGVGQHLQDMVTESEIGWSVSQFLMYSAVAAGVVGVVGYFFLLGPGLLIGLAAGAVPYFLVRSRAEARGRMMLEQLPEALDLMARSLQAGLGLSDAFKMCAEELPLPLAGEFGRVFEEVRFGRDYRTALTGMLDRNPRLFELRMFVSSVLLQRETGGNLIEVLNSISNTIRNRFLFNAKVKALTSEARFSALILACLPLGVFMILLIMNPDYVRPLYTDTWGYYMMGAILILYSIGGFLMYSVSQVEV
jgi:tight adherence protein B